MAAGLASGYSSKLYRNTATWGSPTWDEITAAIDVAVGLSRGKAEVKARSVTFKSTLPLVAESPLTFSMIADTSIADYNILRDAFAASTLLGYAVADQAIATSGADYWKCEYYIYGFNYIQGLEEANRVELELDTAYSSNAPAWVDVA